MQINQLLSSLCIHSIINIYIESHEVFSYVRVFTCKQYTKLIELHLFTALFYKDFSSLLRTHTLLVGNISLSDLAYVNLCAL